MGPFFLSGLLHQAAIKVQPDGSYRWVRAALGQEPDS